MENAINTLYIQNFKSIRSALLHPRRVNLIIGQPNVGKSTLLEAMSLLGSLPYEQKKRFMGSFIRYEKPAQLFHDSLVANTVKVETDRDVCLLGKSRTGGGYKYASFSQEVYQEMRAQLGLPLLGGKGAARTSEDGAMLERLHAHLVDATPLPNPGYLYTEFDRRGRVHKPETPDTRFLASPATWKPGAIRAYHFKRRVEMDRRYPDLALHPPHGDNLVRVLETHPELRREFADLFTSHGLTLRVRVDTGRFEVVKDLEGLSYTYPYTNSGDTLQRFGFYLAALESNRKAVVVLEEPEAHSYPKYVAQLGQRIATNQSNQFFVTTHSPYLMTEVLENMVPYESRMTDLAVFVAYYEDYQTKFRQLSDAEVRTIYRDSVDVFLHLDQLVQASVMPKPAGKKLARA